IEVGSVSPISADRLEAPTVSSIALISRGEGPMWRRAKSMAASLAGLKGAFMSASLFNAVSGRVRLVGGFIHQPAELASVGDLHLEEPGLAGSVGIDKRGLGLEHLVRDRRIDVGGGLDRFDHRCGFGLLQVAADLGQLDKHDITELRLGIIGDPDGCDIALDAEPFVIGGEEGGHGWSFSACRCWERREWRQRAGAGAARAPPQTAGCRSLRGEWAHSPWPPAH